jgi:hypothetical protein
MKTIWIQLSLLVLVSTLVVACSGGTNSQQDQNSQVDSLIQAETNSTETQTEETATEIDPNREGGSFSVEIDGKTLNINTEHSDNGYSYDAASKNATLMAGSPDNNITINVVGGDKGDFSIVSSADRSASISLHITQEGGKVIDVTLVDGKLQLDYFDAKKASAKGTFEGVDANGKALMGSFELNFANKM